MGSSANYFGERSASPDEALCIDSHGGSRTIPMEFIAARSTSKHQRVHDFFRHETHRNGAHSSRLKIGLRSCERCHRHGKFSFLSPPLPFLPLLFYPAPSPTPQKSSFSLALFLFFHSLLPLSTSLHLLTQNFFTILAPDRSSRLASPLARICP